MPGGAARGKRPCAGGEGGRLAEGTPLLQCGQVCACQGIPLCRTRFCRLTHLQKRPCMIGRPGAIANCTMETNENELRTPLQQHKT